MVLELVGVSLVICFAQVHHLRGNQPSQLRFTLARHALRVPTVLILMGIVGLGVVLVVEIVEISLGAAVAMSGCLVFGVVLCILLFVYGSGGWVDGNAGARKGGNV
jgi:hypothetical protein